MSTGAHLKITQMGEAVLGVKLEGNKAKPEPIHFRVVLPFGDVDIVRTMNGEYWVHVRTNNPNDGNTPERKMGRFIDARIDLLNKHASDCETGDFGNPSMNHMAVRVGEA